MNKSILISLYQKLILIEVTTFFFIDFYQLILEIVIHLIVELCLECWDLPPSTLTAPYTCTFQESMSAFLKILSFGGFYQSNVRV